MKILGSEIFFELNSDEDNNRNLLGHAEIMVILYLFLKNVYQDTWWKMIEGFSVILKYFWRRCGTVKTLQQRVRSTSQIAVQGRINAFGLLFQLKFERIMQWFAYKRTVRNRFICLRIFTTKRVFSFFFVVGFCIKGYDMVSRRVGRILLVHTQIVTKQWKWFTMHKEV